ncbi:MAG: ATP-binding protein, partial [Acidobacteriota bacterium]|nr:ATP-binding protein [Acidobacteriota bacterium]
MTDVLKRIYNACNPYLPAPADYYYDCAEARGSSALAKEFQRRLTLADNYVYFLFSGHIGCGKSSELLQLERMLTQAE